MCEHGEEFAVEVCDDFVCGACFERDMMGMSVNDFAKVESADKRAAEVRKEAVRKSIRNHKMRK